MNLRSGKTYNYFEKCEKCHTLNKVMKGQAKADRAVACGQISEGEYLKLSDLAKKLYEWLTESCNCLEPEDDHRELEDYGVIIDVVDVTIQTGRFQGRVILRESVDDGRTGPFRIYDRETIEEIGWAEREDPNWLRGGQRLWRYHFY